MQRKLEDGTYHVEWMEKEGIPIYKAAAGIEDVTELPRQPWARMGGLGTFIEMHGPKQIGRLLYVAEIPGGKALEPEKHLYDELIYILRGRGLAEVWHHGKKTKHTFEWGEGSLFAMPLNLWHKMVNGGREPVLFLARTNAPAMINALHNTEFIFNCDYNFTDRYSGKPDFFLATDKRYKTKRQSFWETNFVPDVRSTFLDDASRKAAGGTTTSFRLGLGPSPHSSEWPVGRHHKAHYHGPEAVLLVLKSVGYALIWPRQYGVHPFQDGHGDEVIKFNWKPNSMYSSGAGYGDWFHQHFNTGPEPARLLALGSTNRSEYMGNTSVRERGGRMIEYEDEDPEVRRIFMEALRKNGVECTMPPVVYRTDPFEIPFSENAPMDLPMGGANR